MTTQADPVINRAGAMDAIIKLGVPEAYTAVEMCDQASFIVGYLLIKLADLEDRVRMLEDGVPGLE